MNAKHCFENAGLGLAPFAFVGFSVRKFQACPGAPIQCGCSCDYCGTGIMNVYEIESADGKRFKVGSDCVAKTGDAGLIGKVKAHRNAAAKAIRTERNRVRIEGQRRTAEVTARMRRAAVRRQAGEFAVAHDLVKAFKVACRGSSKVFAMKLLRDLRTFGNLTPNAVAAVKDLAIKLSPAPSGRVEFTGVIKSIKFKENAFGGSFKAVVMADGGFKVYTTVPESILKTVKIYGRGLEQRELDTLKGRRVQLKVTLKVSDNDPGFAFGSRPNGKLLPTAEQVQATFESAMNH